MKNKMLRLAATAALVLVMLIPVDRVAATSMLPPPTPTQPQVGILICIPVAIVIGIGIGGAIIIIHWCNQLPPPPSPPLPIPPRPPFIYVPPLVPMAHPSDDGGTKLLNSGPPILPGDTNNVPPDTNAITVFTPYAWVPSGWATNDATVTLGNESVTNGYDISSLGYYQTNGAGGDLYAYYFKGVITNLSSSTNLTDWNNYTYEAWVSTNGVLTLITDGTAPVCTNYSASVTPGQVGATVTNTAVIWAGAEQRKFFKAALTP